jgi:Fungal specific transcription factor domain/Fungal Zn(2)-Cys(6) binuclear cluster domain
MQGACDRCHRRKSKCDRLQPCTPCRKAGISGSCHFTDRRRDRLYQREHVEALERKLQALETQNKILEESIEYNRQQPITNSSDPARHSPGLISRISAKGSDDVVAEVSYLSINAGGERQWLGPTSGVVLADLIKANLNLPTGPGHVSPPDERPDSARLSGNRGFHPAVDKPPDERAAKFLLDRFLQHGQVVYPFLDATSLCETFQLVYGEPGFYSQQSFQVFQFDMILAIAVTDLTTATPHMLPNAEVHHARAMSVMPLMVQKNALQSLQAILLVCQYRMISPIQDTSASLWHLVGMAARLAYELGLHRESSYPLERPPAESSRTTIARYREQELRRYTFFCVVCLDRIVSIILGRPFAIKNEDVELDIPNAENGDVLMSRPGEDSKHAQTNLQIFTLIVRYRLLCGEITATLHRRHRPAETDAGIRRIRDSIASRLDAWRSDCNHLELGQDGKDVDSTFRSKLWYEILYHNARLLLYRPSPTMPDLSGDFYAIERIYESSRQSILLYGQLHRAKQLNYSWMTLHSVFMAGLSLIFAASCYFRGQKRDSLHSTITISLQTIDLVRSTRTCSQVLVAVSERWKSLRRCNEVFDRLSDALISDSVQYQASQTHRSERLTRSDSQHQRLRSRQNAHNYNSHDFFEPQHSATSGPSPSTAWSSEPAFESNSLYHGMSNNDMSSLAIDTEFQACFDDMQQMYSSGNFEGPLVQLSRDWLGTLEDWDPNTGLNGDMRL